MRTRYPTIQKQKGVALLMTMVIVGILTATAVSFLDSTINMLKNSSSEADVLAADNLVETGLDLIYSRFNNMDDLAASDINMNDQRDIQDGYVDPADPVFNLGYSYMVDGGTTPVLLQIIKSGEELGIGGCSITTNLLPNSCTADTGSTIESLFVDGVIHPIVLTKVGSNITISNNSWANEPAKEKVAVWIEYVKNPNIPNQTDIYLLGVAQVGKVKTFEQRSLGLYGK